MRCAAVCIQLSANQWGGGGRERWSTACPSICCAERDGVRGRGVRGCAVEGGADRCAELACGSSRCRTCCRLQQAQTAAARSRVATAAAAALTAQQRQVEGGRSRLPPPSTQQQRQVTERSGVTPPPCPAAPPPLTHAPPQLGSIIAQPLRSPTTSGAAHAPLCVLLLRSVALRCTRAALRPQASPQPASAITPRCKLPPRLLRRWRYKKLRGAVDEVAAAAGGTLGHGSGASKWAAFTPLALAGAGGGAAVHPPTQSAILLPLCSSTSCPPATCCAH